MDSVNLTTHETNDSFVSVASSSRLTEIQSGTAENSECRLSQFSMKPTQTCPLGYSQLDLNCDDMWRTETESDSGNKCCGDISNIDVAQLTAKLDRLESTWENMRKKIKLHEDNIDEMQERLYLYEHGTPGTFFANVKYYIALIKCTVIPFVIIEVFYRVLF
uniref:Uncharacterized protein n=1 Tax=Ciona savignyi TaxID=51511 RepID=H2ZEZ3_CIOSA